MGVILSLSFLVMALASSGIPSATAWRSLCCNNVTPYKMLFGRHVGRSPVTTPLGNKLNALRLEVSLDKEDVAVTFQLYLC